jgi:hypothetical protein
VKAFVDDQVVCIGKDKQDWKNFTLPEKSLEDLAEKYIKPIVSQGLRR